MDEAKGCLVEKRFETTKGSLPGVVQSDQELAHRYLEGNQRTESGVLFSEMLEAQ